MVEQTITGRYTVVQRILEQHLDAWFGAGNFKIIVSIQRVPFHPALMLAHSAATAQRLRQMEGRSPKNAR